LAACRFSYALNSRAATQRRQPWRDSDLATGRGISNQARRSFPYELRRSFTNRHAFCYLKWTHHAAPTTPLKLRPNSAMTDESTHACFAAGTDCGRACLRCADACAGYPGWNELESVLRDCFTACVLWLADLYEQDLSLTSSALVCAVACETCAIKCEQSHDESLWDCASECRRCAELCRSTSIQLAHRHHRVISPNENAMIRA
jgi:hypothetical protein